MIIEAKDYGIAPGKEIGRALNDLLASLAGNDEDKEIVLEKGNYYIDTENCPVRYLHVTNTMGEKEYDPGEEKWRHVIGILFEGIKNLTFSGNDSTVFIDGIADNVVFNSCENVTLRDLEIRVIKPNAHRLVTKRRSLTKLVLDVDSDQLVEEDGKLYFVGKDYKHPLMFRAEQNYFNSSIPEHPSYFTRIRHPLFMKKGIKYDPEKNVITARGFFPRKFYSKGRDYYIYDNRRRNVGVFAQKCKNLRIENYVQRFSYSLALVCQDCDGLTFDKLNMSPVDIKTFGFASIADFLHLCCCRGQITVRNSYFSSSGDDVLNVHGIHFLVTGASGNEITVKFCHSQAYGFNIFHPGDKIAFIDRNSLLEQGAAAVVKSEMLDLYTVKLTLDTEISKDMAGKVIENVSACPDVLFEKNRFERISTRGILLTTRGKVVVRDNDFIFTKMWAIEVADDARDWYESGMLTDLTVENNRFIECTQELIHIFPHNILHKGYVHNNILIKNNEFHLKRRSCYIVRSAGNVRMIGNKYHKPPFYCHMMIKLSSDVREKDF